MPYSTVNFSTALSLLLKGGVVVLPTETVYGLAGRMDKPETLRKIFLLKKRPLFDPLIVHCYSKVEACELMARKSLLVEKLFDFFSPGPLTVVTLKNKKTSPLITAGKSTLAIRIPKHPVMLKILKSMPVPLVAPSANMYGEISPVCASHASMSFLGKVSVLDGGKCEKGLESTIVFPKIKEKKIIILRPGMITKKDIEFFLKKTGFKNITVEYQSDAGMPGGGKSHYKPKSPLCIIENKDASQRELQYFLKKKFPGKKLLELKMRSLPQYAARYLYSDLRILSNGKNVLIWVRKTPHGKGGLWDVIWDRLHKASLKYYKNLKI